MIMIMIALRMSVTTTSRDTCILRIGGDLLRIKTASSENSSECKDIRRFYSPVYCYA